MNEKAWTKIPGELWESRVLVWQLAKNDFRKKYAGSYLGRIWAFIQPVVTVLVYWFVFEKGLGNGSRILAREGLSVSFVLYLVSGLVPWFFFQDALNGGTGSLLEYSYLVKKVVFRISALPLVKVMSALFVHVFFLLFCLLLFALYGYYPDLYVLQVLYYSAALFFFTLGFCYLTSAVNVFFRDLAQVIGIALQVGIWVTPIMWSMETLSVPETLVPLFQANPLYYIVTGYRDALIGKVWFWEHPLLTLYFWGLTLVCFILGTAIFERLRMHFADVL